MKNLTIEVPLRKKSWEELSSMTIELMVENRGLQAELKEEKDRSAYWYGRCVDLEKKLEDLRNESVSVLRKTDKVGENQDR